MFSKLRNLVKFSKFDRKFLYSTFGFIDVYDESKFARIPIFHELMRAQAQFSSKIALICPEKYIDSDMHDSYSDFQYLKIITNPISNDAALLNLVEDNYSIFIFDLKTCFMEQILTRDMYIRYMEFALKHYFSTRALQKVSTPFGQLYKLSDPKLKYVTDTSDLTDATCLLEHFEKCFKPNYHETNFEKFFHYFHYYDWNEEHNYTSILKILTDLSKFHKRLDKVLNKS